MPMIADDQCTDVQFFRYLKDLKGDSAFVADVIAATSRYVGGAFNVQTAKFQSFVAAHQD